MNQVIRYSTTICSPSTPAPEIVGALPFTSNNDSVNEIKETDIKGRLKVRAKMEDFAKAFQGVLGSETGDMDKVNEEGLEEHFVNGAYIRGLRIPKGHVIVSKLWTKPRFWIITEGEVTFTTELYKKRIKAPFTGIAPYGSRVVLYAHEETMWYAITGSDKTDNESVEDEIFTETHLELIGVN